MVGPTSIDDYLNLVFSHLSKNDITMNLSEVALKFGSIRSFVSSRKKLSSILEDDVRNRFVVQRITKGKKKGELTVRTTKSKSDKSPKQASIDIPCSCDDYLRELFDHLSQQDIAMDLNKICAKFGSIGKHLPKVEGKKQKTLKKILEDDSRTRFIVEATHNGAMVRANTKLNARNPSLLEEAPMVSGIAPKRTMFDIVDSRSFDLDENTKCYYIDRIQSLEIGLERIYESFDNDRNNNNDTVEENMDDVKSANISDHRFVSLGCCEGANGDLVLLQIATNKHVHIIDCTEIGNDIVRSHLGTFLLDEGLTKLVHDLNEFTPSFQKLLGSATATAGLRGSFDTQLMCEWLWRSPFMGLNEFLTRLNLPKHQGREFFVERQKAGFDPWSKRPIAKQSLEHAAQEVFCLQRAAKHIQDRMDNERQFQQFLLASATRVQNSFQNPSSYRTLCFDMGEGRFSPSSKEFMLCFCPNDMFSGEPLIVESDVDEILSILPPLYSAKLQLPVPSNTNHSEGCLPIENLSDIVLDIGRRGHCWMNDSRVFLSDDTNKLVEEQELDIVVSKLGNFGSDNRAGLAGTHRNNGSLHRFSAIRDRDRRIVGITIRVGRNVRGNASMLIDLLMHNKDKSILILGEPGSGKTTIVREATRKLAEEQNVIVVDTSNEIAGDGRTPHTCIGLARRMMVPSLDKQGDVMVECVQNHTPHVMVIDEIGRPKEVKAASTVKQRGVRMLASAHGDLRKLLKNGDLNGLVGGLETVTLGDMLAKEQAKEKQKRGNGGAGGALATGGGPLKISKTMTKRKSAPVFEIIVEVSRDSRHDWRIVHDSASAVDRILEGLSYSAELRRRNPETGAMWVKLEDA